ncbi:MAG TPA: NAD(P)-dependent oxidoreductase [Actinomycetota bacterium]|nr:NAD(P)-dependent oxidoreductase [Actinomycetota bacterium]
MVRLLIVDPLLVTEEFGIGPGWAGAEHDVVIPAGFSTAELRSPLETAEGILTAHAPVTEEMILSAPSLRLVAKPGAGVDNIDVGAASARGVVVTNVQGVRGRAVAEHALMMMMYLARHAWMRDDPAWQGTTGVQMGGKTLGVAGFGEIGALLARFGDGLGMEVVAHTRTPDPSRAPDVPVRFVAREQLFRDADVVVLSLPLTDATRHMVDRQALALMKETAYLVNVSRGPVVATDDLVEALREGRLAGVGLDVTDPEPLPPGHELRSFSRVLISPHNAGRTVESQAEALGRMRDNVRAVLAGEEPRDLVTP